MTLLVGESHHLVFERGTVPRADAGDLAVVERRPADAVPHDLVNALGCVNEMAGNLLAGDLAGQERERDNRIVTEGFGELREIDRPPVEARRSPRLQPPHDDASRRERRRQLARWRFTRPAGGALLVADVHQSVQKGAGRHDERVATNGVAFLERQPCHAARGGQHPSGAPQEPRDVRLARERLANPGAIAALVGLCARRPDRRAPAPVEQLELNARGVDRQSHEAAERVDLTNEMSLCGAADRRIARHQRHGLRRKRAQPDAASEPRRSPCRFAAGMPGADDDDVEVRMAQRQDDSRSRK